MYTGGKLNASHLLATMPDAAVAKKVERTRNAVSQKRLTLDIILRQPRTWARHHHLHRHGTRHSGVSRWFVLKSIHREAEETREPPPHREGPPVNHPVYPATVSTPDASGNVTVTIGDSQSVTVPWRGSAIEAVNEALDLLDQLDPVVDETCYPFVAIEQLLAELTPEDRKAG